MRDKTKYQGIIPAFYACYDEEGRISPERVERLTGLLLKKGVKGLYVGGSSGECIYQSTAERKTVLEHVMKASKGQMTIIAHVACNNTADSCELAAHAQSLGVDAIAAIPPIYFHLPEYAIADYWNAISAAAPELDFIIYNIPQLAGTALTLPLFRKMLENPRVIGVKNSSMPVQDIQMFKQEGGPDCIVMNGPDEQLLAGLAIGADGGIGGTYGVMPELYLKIRELFDKGRMEEAREIQYAADEIIYNMCKCHGNLYAVMKKIIAMRDGVELGSVRSPLPALTQEDMPRVAQCAEQIDAAIRKYCEGEKYEE
ncbi:MAG: N-acetylneuraminate lyase [Lachnospiraceae bacterium]|nr:N-acetylneuraminate lyase [Lachnospiraceae bacterium]